MLLRFNVQINQSPHKQNRPEFLLPNHPMQRLTETDFSPRFIACRYATRVWILKGMPGRGLEPLRIAPPDPKSGASANFATLASWIDSS